LLLKTPRQSKTIGGERFVRKIEKQKNVDEREDKSTEKRKVGDHYSIARDRKSQKGGGN